MRDVANARGCGALEAIGILLLDGDRRAMEARAKATTRADAGGGGGTRRALGWDDDATTRDDVGTTRDDDGTTTTTGRRATRPFA
jgi:hypothetical protein